MNKINRVMMADSYKYSHGKQYPSNMVSMFDYMESRGGVYSATVFVGLQGFLKQYLTDPITQKEVDEAERFANLHGVPFDSDGWNYIVNNLGGKIPVEIRAVKEGSLIPVKNVLLSVESTDENVPWIAGWLETMLMRLWYPTNIATKSYYVKRMLQQYGTNDWSMFAYHNFGSRGSSCTEASMIGGFAHLTQFMGTDNFDSLKYCNEYYYEPLAGFSVFATEHSTTTANAEGDTKKEMEFVLRMLEENPEAPIMSFVADSYDVYNFTRVVTDPNSDIGKLVRSRPNQKFVIRPDSGDPIEVITKMLKIMEENDVFDTVLFGRKLSSNYGILWGDGISPEVIEDILYVVTSKGYAAENFVFGSGGDLMQKHDRDTQKFAIKCSSIRVKHPVVTEDDPENRWNRYMYENIDVFKDPITDPGKKSKKGRITTYFNKETREYFVDEIGLEFETAHDILETVYLNGELLVNYSLEDIRKQSDRIM